MYLSQKKCVSHTVHVWMLHHLYLFSTTYSGWNHPNCGINLQIIPSPSCNMKKKHLKHHQITILYPDARTPKKSNPTTNYRSSLPHIHNVDTNRLPKAAWVVSNLDLRVWLGPSSNVDQRCRSHPPQELPPTVKPNTRNVRIFCLDQKNKPKNHG